MLPPSKRAASVAPQEQPAAGLASSAKRANAVGNFEHRESLRHAERCSHGHLPVVLGHAGQEDAVVSAQLFDGFPELFWRVFLADNLKRVSLNRPGSMEAVETRVPDLH